MPYYISVGEIKLIIARELGLGVFVITKADLNKTK
jgi:hypothetical protein